MAFDPIHLTDVAPRARRAKPPKALLGGGGMGSEACQVQGGALVAPDSLDLGPAS